MQPSKAVLSHCQTKLLAVRDGPLGFSMSWSMKTERRKQNIFVEQIVAGCVGETPDTDIITLRQLFEL